MTQPEKNNEPIPTPFPLLVRRFRYQVMPALTVLAALVVAGLLYVRNGGVYANVGEVNLVRATVNAKLDGVLDEPSERSGLRAFKLHDTVTAGTVIARLEKGPIEAQITRYDEELDRLKKELAALSRRGGKAPATAPASADDLPESDGDPVTSAVRIAMASAHAKRAELEAMVQHLEIKAPISGRITAIRALPGQAVRAGDPIMTIASDEGQFIVSYVRTSQPVRPLPNQQVDVRVRSTQTVHSARVISVGPQVELVPEQQCRDPKVPEWGVPVHVSLPEHVSLRPGEIVDLVFHPRGSGARTGDVARRD